MQAVGPSGKHIFWMGNRPGPQPASRIRLGLLPPRRLGTSTSRLDSLPIAAIQNRILISPIVARFQQALADYASQFGYRKAPATKILILDQAMKLQFPTLTDDEMAVLTAVQADPTDEELKDLSLIDGFFRGADEPKYVSARPELTLTEGVCAALDPKGNHGLHGMGMASYAPPPTPGGVIGQWLLYEPPTGRGGWGFSRNTPNATSDEIDSIKNSSFFCAAPQSWPYPNDIRIDWPSFFGIDQNQTWGAVKRQVKNAQTMMGVIWSYPFPTPFDLHVAQWWFTAQSDLQTYAKGDPVNPEGFRYWITLSVLMNYDGMVDRIEADAKKKAKKARRKNMMKVIGIAIAGIIAPYLLPALVVVAAALIKAAIDTYMTLQAQKKAAKDMAEAAKLFESDDPAFAIEVRNAADMMNSEAAQTEADIPLPPDVQAELQPEPGAPMEVHPLVIGGGIAAAIGLTALAIFKG